MAFLSTAGGAGGVRVDVDAYGSFGSGVGVGVSDAIYDPVGSLGPAGTVFESGVAIGLDAADTRTVLTTGLIGDVEGLVDPGFVSTIGAAGVVSVFEFGSLGFGLNQDTTDLVNSAGDRTGSQITQIYTITNRAAQTVSFDLFRYLDGDLLFDDTSFDRGGLFIDGDRELLFQIDAGGNPAIGTTLVGITAEGGDTSGPGRFELNAFPDVKLGIIDGNDLTDTLAGDGPDADRFVDAGNALDATLALRNDFVLAPGAIATYTTTTRFGTGTPAAVARSSGSARVLVIGTARSDTLDGTSGDEDFRGLAGDDFIVALGGNDRVLGGLGNDGIAGNGGDDILLGNGGSDRLAGNGGSDRILGGFGNDQALGGSGDDLIRAGLGDDRVVGGSGDDELLGNRGEDRIVGGAGDDRIIGGFDSDRITGGGGSDTMVYRSIRDGFDTITDFELGTDRIDVRRLLRRSGLTAGASALGDTIQLGGGDNRTVVSFDRDGADGSRDPLRLAVLAGVSLSAVSAESFVFA